MAAEARIRRALISVSDKHGIEEFARSLHGLGVELVSTGGTARLLAGAGIPVVEVSALTGFPEIMAGRVKTLHPRVHGGLLGRRGADDEVMREHGIEPIDLLAVNLYPFERTIDRPDCRFAEAVENIDIGGPAMLRAGGQEPRRRHRGVGPGRLSPGNRGDAAMLRGPLRRDPVRARRKGVCPTPRGMTRPLQTTSGRWSIRAAIR